MNTRDDTMPLPACCQQIESAYLSDETTVTRKLAAGLADLNYSDYRGLAEQLVQTTRAAQQTNLLQAFLTEFSLSTEEGLVLMSLAEALLRIPDHDTQNRLIEDKLSGKDWTHHLGHSPSRLVNASAWGLLITGSLVDSAHHTDQAHAEHFFSPLLHRLGAPLIRQALQQAVKLLGEYFIGGEVLRDALDWADTNHALCSFDMLGEGAITADDAEAYLHRYQTALNELTQYRNSDSVDHGLSIKLSALHPRYEPIQRERVLKDLTPKVLDLVRRARESQIPVTIDAEEAHRMMLSLEIFETVFGDAELRGWNGFGLALQAYQKRALPTLKWLAGLARTQHKRIPVRLVKGAYWDTEIKRAQQLGLEGYPVFTHKWATDLSYLACAQFLLQNPDTFYPQFATHNALTIAAIDRMAPSDAEFEFQRLYGMGEDLYQGVAQTLPTERPCRVYVPVGKHQELLPYLVRRMLENGANTSFVHQLGNPQIDQDALLRDPLDRARRSDFQPHPNIPLPTNIFQPRKNSRGINTDNAWTLEQVSAGLLAKPRQYLAKPIVLGHILEGKPYDVINPADPKDIVGQCHSATAVLASQALSAAHQAHVQWNETGVERRAACLIELAEHLESQMPELIQLCIREGGRCYRDALAEVREAIDFCRYYADQAIHRMACPQEHRGVAGEKNLGLWRGRGIFICISPWNFPLAIFTGQIAAALVTGNCVIAKPASATPLIAAQVIQLFHQSGVPANVLQFLPGCGAALSETLLTDARVAGVAFTGSIETARHIQRTLASRDAPIASLIAETGGQNVMIADSSALSEQLIQDVIRSAFNSAGQRCSALRVLCLPHDVADSIIERLIKAMREQRMGDPARLSTDIGPLINRSAKTDIDKYINKMTNINKVVYQINLPPDCVNLPFLPPTLCTIDELSELTHEVFGPVLHLLRYHPQQLDALLDSVNAMSYGLTLGIHSRIESLIEYIQQRVRVGNVYVNRDMIGAVVESQPFGGIGLSGTGSKAGGADYLKQFAYPVSVSNNTAALGGDARLISQIDD